MATSSQLFPSRTTYAFRPNALAAIAPFERVLVGAAGLVMLAVAFLASLMMHEPRVFTLSVPVAGGLILAQGAGSTA